MSQLDPRVPKLEALLTRIKARAAEPRPRVLAAPPAAPVQVAPVPSAPPPVIVTKGPATAPPPTAPPPTAPPPTAPPPTAPPAEALVRSAAPHTVSGPPPSRRSHGALPAVSPPPARPSSPSTTAVRADEQRKTPIPTSGEPPSFGSDATLSAVRIDADSSVDALLAADYDDATIQASVERPSTTLAGVGVPVPVVTRPPIKTPIPEAPASAPRAIEAAYEEEDRRHTPPPESGKQKAPSLAPGGVVAARKSGELPRLNEDDPSDDEGTLAGVGGGLGAPGAKVTGAVVAEAKPVGPAVYAASLPKGTVAAATSGAAAPAEPRSLGDLLDLTLAL